MRRVARMVALATLVVMPLTTVFAIDPAPPFQDPVMEERYKQLTHELRCLKCQGETIADTHAMFAVDLRRQVREMLASGQSDVQIRDYMVDRYGEVILLRPKWSARTAGLWIAPALLLIGGAVVAWRVVRQRAVLLETDDEPVEPRA